MNLWTGTVVFGILNGALLVAVLMSGPHRSQLSTKLVAILLAVLSLIFLDSLLMVRGYYARYSFLIFSSASLWFVVGPLLYMHLRALCGDLRLHWWLLVHFIPTVMVLALVMVPFYWLPTETKVEYFQRGSVSATRHVIFEALLLIQMASYIVASFTSLQKVEKSIKSTRSQTPKHLPWMRTALLIVGGYLGLRILWHLFPINMLFGGADFLILTLFIHAVALFAINYPVALYEEEPVATTKAKYKTSGLDEAEMERISHRLSKLIIDEEAHRDPDLTLGMLAERLSIPAHHLSQVLNQHIGKSFYDYVNSFRVEAMIKYLSDDAYLHRTMLDIGLDVGFASKSSMNRVFRQLTGKSPTEIKKRARVSGG